MTVFAPEIMDNIYDTITRTISIVDRINDTIRYVSSIH